MRLVSVLEGLGIARTGANRAVERQKAGSIQREAGGRPCVVRHSQSPSGPVAPFVTGPCMTPGRRAACSGGRHRTGTPGGAHCLGGAYAVGPGLLNRRDLLDWRPWIRTGLSEDVVVGLLAAVSHLSVRGSVGSGEAFGLAWRNLPLPPAKLIEQGYSLVHSVRDQAYGDETDLRAYFRSRRSSPASI